MCSQLQNHVFGTSYRSRDTILARDALSLGGVFVWDSETSDTVAGVLDRRKSSKDFRIRKGE